MSIYIKPSIAMFQNGQHRGGSSFLDIAQCMLNWQSLSEGETLSWRFQIENLSYNGHLELSFFFFVTTILHSSLSVTMIN